MRCSCRLASLNPLALKESLIKDRCRRLPAPVQAGPSFIHVSPGSKTFLQKTLRSEKCSRLVTTTWLNRTDRRIDPRTATVVGLRHVRLPDKYEAPASEYFTTCSLADASFLYSQWFSRPWCCSVHAESRPKSPGGFGIQFAESLSSIVCQSFNVERSFRTISQ